jgi:hypothetical protein
MTHESVEIKVKVTTIPQHETTVKDITLPETTSTTPGSKLGSVGNIINNENLQERFTRLASQPGNRVVEER